MTTLTEILNNPEVHYPGNFDTLERANALLTGLCQDAATEIVRLNKAVADEREACAKVIDKMLTDTPIGSHPRTEALFFAARNIRARGNT